MKITSKLLHLPPHITTTWNHVKALYMKELALIVVLDDDKLISIENLAKETLDQVFAAYSTYLETPPQQMPIAQAQNPQFMMNAGPANAGAIRPIGRFNFDALDPSGMAMQHNPEQADTPEFPQEVLSKIAAIAKIVAPEDAAIFPKPEPHCNCPHCQIARAINKGADLIPHADEQHQIIEAKVTEEEVVTAKDLEFPDWSIAQIGQNLYDVTSRLDTNEKYRVYLGEPLGCTCGKAGCEHILAVLKS